ncbi:hypothetical protein FQN54_005114 [Arachnomyces sp. PD_36]|nr:hypothetical protein FQN54_005114 [Arachnomyces sp. PD_36]
MPPPRQQPHALSQRIDCTKWTKLLSSQPRISTYLSTTNVQLGATYSVSQKSTALYTNGIKAAAEYINASPDDVVLGSSTTQLLRNLSIALQPSLKPGDEIILSQIDHEANLAPWVQLAEWRGLVVKWWDPVSTAADSAEVRNPKLKPEVLKGMLTPRTRLVACTHASNVLGTINDVRAIADTVHTIPGALLCVDGVTLAPHRRIDMQALGVDFYAFSWYKVYGPHISILYANPYTTSSAITPLGHYFNPTVTLTDKLSLAGTNYELLASLPYVTRYCASLPWDAVENHEGRMQEVLLSYLRSKDEVVILGEQNGKAEVRIPIISFFILNGKGARKRSGDIVQMVEARSQFAIRAGHLYSKRMLDEIVKVVPGLELEAEGVDDGVVRVSLAHYNTIEEVTEFVKVLDEVLSVK